MKKYNNDNIDDVFLDYASNDDYGYNNEFEDVAPQKKYINYDGEQKLEQDTVNAKCPDCGGNLQFDADSGNLVCPLCGNHHNINASRNVLSKEFDPSLDIRVDNSDDTRVFRCQNCGAETVFNMTEFAADCAYCGSPNVVATNEIEGIKPDVVIPFAISQKNARDYYIKWIKKKFFAPHSLKANVDINCFQGVYSPCWLFDADTHSYYSGRAGKYYYVTVGSGKNRRTERRVRWFNVKGNKELPFSNVLIEAGPRLDQAHMNKLKPFPIEKIVKYDKSFIMGFKADHYDTGINESWVSAKNLIDKDIGKAVRSEIMRKADVIDYVNITTHYLEKKYKYALLPVYVGRMKFKEKLFNFFTNGVTGKCAGKYPISKLKVAMLVALGVIAVVGTILILHFTGQLDTVEEVLKIKL